MPLTDDFATVRFALGDAPDLAPGDLFITCLQAGGTVRAVRAFIAGEDGDAPVPCFVTVGPFARDGNGGPEVLQPVGADPTPVIKLKGAKFRPSLLPEDLRRREAVDAADLLDCVLLAAGATYLCVISPRPAGHLQAFLDLHSGELLHREPQGGKLVSVAWDLVVDRVGEPPLVLFSHRARHLEAEAGN